MPSAEFGSLLRLELTCRCFQAVKAGLLKILSKMGISLLTRYAFSSSLI